MPTLRVEYKLSEKARLEHAARTGELLDYAQVMKIDLSQKSAEEREWLVPLARIVRGDMVIDLTRIPVKMSIMSVSAGTNPHDVIYAEEYLFDVLPDEGQLLKTAIDFDARRKGIIAKAKAMIEAKKVTEATEKQRKADLEVEAQRIAEYARTISTDEDALRDLLAQTTDEVKTTYVLFNGYRTSLGDVVRKFISPFEQARQKATEAAEAAKIKEWVELYGSERLRKGYARGYDMSRQYVLERAKHELPGWTLDYDQTADWKDRVSPTLAELAAVEEAEKLGFGECKAVWLTDIPRDTTIDEKWEYDQETFEPGPALVLTDYHPKYNAVKIL